CPRSTDSTTTPARGGLTRRALTARTTTRFFFFSSRRRHTRSVSAFLLNRSSDLSQATTNQNVKKRPACSELRWAYCNHKATYFRSEERRVGKECRCWWSRYAVKKTGSYCTCCEARSARRRASVAGDVIR